MSDPEEKPAQAAETPKPDEPREPNAPGKRSRLRRFFLRHLPLTVAGGAVLLAAATAGLYFWASSSEFENLVRKRLVSTLETATGGRVEIASFHWKLLSLEAEASGVVIHGLEGPGEAPYAQIGNLRVGLSVLGFWSPRILLRHLEISRPQLHLIAYADGSTNQPQPKRPRKPGKPVLDTFFDMRVGKVLLEQGVVDYEDRAAAFDFQNRYIPLDLTANDASLHLAYMPPAAGKPESFHIEVGASDLRIARGGSAHREAQIVQGRFEAALDLVRAAVYVRSLRIEASGKTLEVSGTLQDFAHPRWVAKAIGDLDMRLLDPVTGYPFAPQGIAHLDLNGSGQDGQFRADGTVHIDGGSYIGTGVIATGVQLDAHVHADAEQLLITSIVGRLRQGGQMEGSIALNPWLPIIPGAPVLQPTAGKVRGDKAKPKTPAVPLHPPPVSIPVNGQVTANFKDVTLDALLDMVGQQPFQRLGLNALLNGPAKATWTKGDTNTLVVESTLSLNPSSNTVAGEVPASGAVEGTYFQRNGSVDLRKLEVHMPASQLEAHGDLGAYPLTSHTALLVDFHSHDLGEFDQVLRDLGLALNGKTGAGALPIVLGGQADFHGTWTGSLVDPRIAGSAKAATVYRDTAQTAGQIGQAAVCPIRFG
jgi:translocation and assembly module TamB